MIAVVPRDRWLVGDLLAVDRVVRAAEDQGAVDLRADDDLWDEVLLRYQRLCPIGNAASTTPEFFRVVREHRTMHDTRKPLVRAELEHAVDTWQWVLRLQPDAGPEVQLAALLHDVERLESEAEARIEHLDRAFEAAHARRGAAIARALVHVGPWDPERVAALVEGHEQPEADGEARLLADADALSFFALNCAGYLAWFGEELTARKVAYTLERMTDAAREWLPRIRLPGGVRPLVSDRVLLSA